MAQIKNNQVKGTMRTTTPQMRGVVDMQSAMRGVPGATPFNQSMIPGGQSKIPITKGSSTSGIAFPAMGALGVTPNLFKPTQSSQPNISPSFPQTGQTSGPATNSTQQQLDTMMNQALDIKSQLNQQRNTQNTKTAPEPQGFFPGVLNQLLGASKPTREQERARREMERISAGNKAIADEAKRVSDQYGAEIARVGGLGAGAVAGNLSTGSNVVGSGNAAIASQSASARMDALAKGQQAALEGTAQQLTGQEQAAEAFKPSLEASLIQQQQGITGLSNTANYSQPTQVQPGSTLFAPVGGEEIAGGLGGWANYTTAQQVQGLIEQYPDAGVIYNPNLTPQQNAQIIQQAIQGSPSYQRGTYGAAGANSYLGAQQLGAAGNMTQTVAPLQAIASSADANFNVMLDIMKRGNINDMNQPALNQLENAVKRGLASDSDVVAFESAIETVRSQYAAILGGGTPTDTTQGMALKKIPPNVSLGALQEVEKTMRALTKNSVAGYNQQIGAYSNQGGNAGGGGGLFDF